MSDFAPYDLNALFQGTVRFCLAPYTEPVPVNLDDILDPVAPYAVAGTWFDAGATEGSADIDRAFEVTGRKINQADGQVLKRVSNVTRKITLQLAEFSPKLLQLFEEAPLVEAIAAAPGRSAVKKIAFGTASDLTEYRVALIGRRLKKQGIVQEGAAVDAKKRGRYLAYVGYRGSLEAESSKIQLSETEGALLPVTLELQPEPTIAVEGQEHGFWIDEDAGVIVTA